jgi:hypothetical protein
MISAEGWGGSFDDSRKKIMFNRHILDATMKSV